jgi:cytochrome P450
MFCADAYLTYGLAGHETTGATLSRVMPELQKQPHIMARMRQEQAELIEKYGEEITCESATSIAYRHV